MPGTITTKFFVVFKNASGKELRRGFESEDDQHALRVVRWIALRDDCHPLKPLLLGSGGGLGRTVWQGSLNELEGLLCALAHLNPPPTAKFRRVLRFRIHGTSDTAQRKNLPESEAG
jgi:hypothetical protein